MDCIDLRKKNEQYSKYNKDIEDKAKEIGDKKKYKRNLRYYYLDEEKELGLVFLSKYNKTVSKDSEDRILKISMTNFLAKRKLITYIKGKLSDKPIDSLKAFLGQNDNLEKFYSLCITPYVLKYYKDKPVRKTNKKKSTRKKVIGGRRTKKKGIKKVTPVKRLSNQERLLNEMIQTWERKKDVFLRKKSKTKTDLFYNIKTGRDNTKTTNIIKGDETFVITKTFVYDDVPYDTEEKVSKILDLFIEKVTGKKTLEITEKDITTEDNEKRLIKLQSKMKDQGRKETYIQYFESDSLYVLKNFSEKDAKLFGLKYDEDKDGYIFKENKIALIEKKYPDLKVENVEVAINTENFNEDLPIKTSLVKDITKDEEDKLLVMNINRSQISWDSSDVIPSEEAKLDIQNIKELIGFT